MSITSPAMVGVALALLPWQAALSQADTVPPAGVTERAFTFQSGALELAGTLTLPEGVERPPITVIVAGSGPTDRNGNQGPRLRTNTYAQLAWGLAQEGIASLRYDKRVLPATKGPISLPDLSFDDFVTDVEAAANAVRDDYAKVFVLGHSEGGSLAIRAASRGLAVDGLVLVATPGRDMVALLHEQLSRQLDTATLVQFDSALARYLRNEEPGDLPPALRALSSFWGFMARRASPWPPRSARTRPKQAGEGAGLPGERARRHANFPVRAFGGASPFQRFGKEPSLPPLLALSFAEDCDQRGGPLWIPPRLREARIREIGSSVGSLDPDL